ncbi:Carbohydrate esterase 4 protein [Mortierella polycephala]|uniref:Carbohydrate esterase 4 protein n=1 Tax=Mortierella polycephala TaxID=41804 RepID=A0A9P6Q8H3_9FUNG|nr:Carbohydrate esterase 4 protein [Mortierella polycephala]
MATLHSSQQARQAPNTFNNTFFPYTITGPAPPTLYQPGQVLDSCIQPNSYAISFDDGPGQLSDELLNYLDEQMLKVTFFMNGDNWNCIYRPESQRLLKRAYNAQHQIATHPWSHRDLEALSDNDIRGEMHKIEDAFRSILGVVPRYMRPPYGEHSERVRKIIEEMGYIMILWDVDRLEPPSFDASKDVSGIGNEFSPEFDSQKQRPMGSTSAHTHHAHVETGFSSKWAEAVRGVPYGTLDRDAMVMGGIYQEATSVWAVEYVQSLGHEVMPVAACLGETDPRSWYKEIGPPAPAGTLPQSCHA